MFIKKHTRPRLLALVHGSIWEISVVQGQRHSFTAQSALPLFTKEFLLLRTMEAVGGRGK